MLKDTGIDFNSADHRQRKLLRVALMDLFRRERSLAMFLDEEMGLVLRDEIDEGPLKVQVYELIQFLAGRGRLDDLMSKLYRNEDYAKAPALRDVMVAWSPVSVEAESSERPATDTVSAPIERILDGDVRRMRPVTWVSGIATLRRRVCLLRGERLLVSGFLVAPNLVATVASPLALLGPDGLLETAIFDYGIGAEDAGVARSIAVGPPRVLKVADRETTPDGPALEYALLPLAEQVGEQRLEDGAVRGWFDLTDTRERLREGELVFMLHHPKGGAMSLSEGVIGPTPSNSGLLAHSCPTAPGSGGAPVVDATLRLVGLHERKRQNWKEAIRADWIARDLAEKGISVSAPPARGMT